MKKTISLILVVLITALTLTGCSKPIYSSGYNSPGFEFKKEVNAKVEADRLLFDRNDVTLNFFYCFYCLDNSTIEQIKNKHENKSNEWSEQQFHYQANYAIYLSNNNQLIFEKDENDRFIDCKNKVNAQLLKYFTFEEAFANDYGYTSPKFKMNYNHSERLTIPEELLISSGDCVYIHIACFSYDVINDVVVHFGERRAIPIKYKLLGDNTVVLIND